MARRGAFLDPDVIEMSRDFVCVRFDPWMDEKNVERIVRLTSYHQNSALCLIPPGAAGLTADSFPTADVCAWGPMDFAPHDGVDAWKKMKERAGRILPAMRKLAKEHPSKPGIDGEYPTLPVMPHLAESLNISACDSRAVIVMVTPEVDADRLEENLRPLVFEKQIAGRAHIVRMTRGEWAAAIDDELVEVSGAENESGVFVVGPDAFGQKGTVLAQAPNDASPEQLRSMLQHGLQAFTDSFKKLDRSSHILEGKRGGVTWEKYKPVGWTKYVVAPSCDDVAPRPE